MSDDPAKTIFAKPFDVTIAEMQSASDDPIERLRAHVEKHKHHQQAFFSTAGLKALLDALDDVRGMFVIMEKELVALTVQRDALKAQVERLLVGKGKDISKALREAQTSRLGVMDERDEEETG